MIVYVKPAKGDLPERAFKVNVRYSLHCFTHELKADEQLVEDLFIRHDGECRVFDFDRWNLSLHLPGIIERLMHEKCFHTGYRNFLTVKLLNHKSVVKYEIYFEVSRASHKGHLNLFVQSAYVRDNADQMKRRHNPPIQFAFILYNTLNNVQIKMPKSKEPR